MPLEVSKCDSLVTPALADLQGRAFHSLAGHLQEVITLRLEIISLVTYQNVPISLSLFFFFHFKYKVLNCLVF